jgi:apolipoprotein N-acyltransferase
MRSLSRLARLLYAFALGALTALAFAPFSLFPLMLLGYAGLVLLLDGACAHRRRLWRAAETGWAFGFGCFIVGLHWIGYPFLVDAEMYEWMMPFAVVLLPAGLALFFGVAAALSASLWRPGPARIFVFALAFFAAEWLRGHILTGFPWNLPGYGWGASIALLQSAAWFGVYGLSLLTLLFGASLALFIRDDHRGRVWQIPCAMMVVFALLWAGGTMRLDEASNATVAGVRLRIVQPDTAQSEKYQPQYIARNWQRLTALSNAPTDQPITHLIWPEAAPPFVLARVPDALAEIAKITANGRVLLTGEVRVKDQGNDKRDYYNSLTIYGADAHILATYDKFHLVPFGEYLPLKPLLSWLGLSQLVGIGDGFSTGPGPQTLNVPGAPPASPLICYEVLFPGEVTASERPAWMVNVTDDSWFGAAAGPRQHFLAARVRAIEEGLPIVRAANSGISAIIDPYGRVRQKLDLGLRGVVDGNLPVALRPTLFVRFGIGVQLILIFACAGAALWPLTIRKA